MGLNANEPEGRIPGEQLVYAGWLDAGTRFGLGLLVLSFAVYVSGVLPPQTGFDELPRLWILPVDRYLAATGLPSGWGWIALLGQGDVREKMQRQGALPVTSTSEQFDAIIRDDTARNSKLLRDAGIGAR